MSETWKQWEGQVLDGKFPLRQYLGGSADAAVFLTEFGAPEPQQAAVKLIPVEPDEARQQLSRVESAAQLSHPRLIRIFQAGLWQHDGQCLLYVVMEYAPEDLSQVIPQRSLTAAETREVLASTLEALAYLHGQGYVHGHLKPANIMAVDDQVKISSDRLCRMGEPSGGSRTRSLYDPPELDRDIIAPSGDVWMLAMTMVEVLTQHLPVGAGGEARKLDLPETLPAPFLEIARNALQENPQRRWTVSWIAASLTQGFSGAPAPVAVPPAKTAARPRYVVPLVSLGGVLAAVLIGSTLLHRNPATEPSVSPPPQQALPRPQQAQPRPKPVPVPAKPVEVVKRTDGGRPSPFGSKPKTKSPAAPIASGTVVPRIAPPPRPTSESVVPEPVISRPAPPARAAGSDAIIHQVLPDVPGKARSTIQGKVKIQLEVQVDAAGNVVEAKADPAGRSRYFEQLAVQAARGWKFVPDGRDAARKWRLRFEFRRSGTEVRSERVAR
ncbi:MAG: TonB family protein [Acidobacteriia bacterium]|nr:TonB family protein [Terriglobia bacterium]